MEFTLNKTITLKPTSKGHPQIPLPYTYLKNVLLLPNICILNVLFSLVPFFHRESEKLKFIIVDTDPFDSFASQ